jgi:two-component SAPR family response regulator
VVPINRNILLVDDEPNTLSGYKRLLSSYFRVHTATSGTGGLQLLEKEGPFAALVVDYAMPGMNGVEFVINARRRAPRTTRIMLSGRGDLDIAIEALNRGSIFAYLKKPVSVEELLYTVIKAVEQYHDQRNDFSGLEDDQLSGLSHLYAGLHYSDLKDTSGAITCFREAQGCFRAQGDQTNILRTNNYLAGEIIETGQLEDDSLYAEELGEIVTEVSAILKAERSLLSPEDQQRYPFLASMTGDGGTGPPAGGQSVSALAGAAEIERFAVQLLGNFYITKGQKQLDEHFWKRPKAKLLFLYLATHRHKKIERDLILESFWPEMTVKQAANNFSSCLYTLRQVLAREIVYFDKGFCWLNKGAFVFDVDQFEAMAGIGSNRMQEGREIEAISDLEEAVSCYTGSYLEEYSYLDWIMVERKRLQRIYLKTLIDLAELLTRQGQYAQAAEVLEKAPVDENYDDAMLYKLIKYYIKAGKTGRAQVRYNYYRDLLIDELGIEPDPKIEQLLK